MESTAFIKIPKDLIYNEKFKKMSYEAKFLYTLFLDRAKLSKKNSWKDENSILIIFTNKEISKTLQCCKTKAIRLVNILKEFKLITTKRVVLGKPNKIYINSFAEESNNECKKSNENSMKNITKNNTQYFSDKERNTTLEKIRENISYKNIYPNMKYSEKYMLDEVVEIMTDTVSSKKTFLNISGEKRRV